MLVRRIIDMDCSFDAQPLRLPPRERVWEFVGAIDNSMNVQEGSYVRLRVTDGCQRCGERDNDSSPIAGPCPMVGKVAQVHWEVGPKRSYSYGEASLYLSWCWLDKDTFDKRVIPKAVVDADLLVCSGSGGIEKQRWDYVKEVISPPCANGSRKS